MPRPKVFACWPNPPVCPAGGTEANADQLINLARPSALPHRDRRAVVGAIERGCMHPFTEACSCTAAKRASSRAGTESTAKSSLQQPRQKMSSAPPLLQHGLKAHRCGGAYASPKR